MTVPVFLAVIIPFFTVTIFFLEDFHFTGCLVPVTFKVIRSPTFNVTFFLFSFGVSTVTLQVYFLFPAFAVIIADPFFLASTLPVLLTVATDFLLEIHVVPPLVSETFNCMVCPVNSIILLLLIFPAADTGMVIQKTISNTLIVTFSIFSFVLPPNNFNIHIVSLLLRIQKY